MPETPVDPTYDKVESAGNPMTAVVSVPLGEGGYDVHIGDGILTQLGDLTHRLGPGKRAMVVTDTVVDGHFGDVVVRSLTQSGFHTHKVVLPPGEHHKTLHTVSQLYDEAVAAHLDRGSVAIALGGGVIGDMTGFFAATYMRGIRFVQCPTTLLAQVDASVGGKTGVNHRAGKNMIGSFHQPALVLADVGALQTLPPREYVAGLAEVVKHGLIADGALFHRLEQSTDELNRRDPALLKQVVAKNVEIKRDVVVQDEKETGLRGILNFGHSVGHAIENQVGYGTYTHGEAIALGMLVETRMSVQAGLLSSSVENRLRRLLRKLALPVTTDAVSAEDVVVAMGRDKKNRDGRLTVALLTAVGQALLRYDVDPNSVAEAFAAVSPS